MQRLFLLMIAVCSIVLLPAAADALVLSAVEGANPVGHLDVARPDAIYGWAYDADAPNQPVEVHIYINGKPVKSLMANRHRGDLVTAKVTMNPFHGFGWVPEGLSDGTHRVEVYAINLGPDGRPTGLNPKLRGTQDIAINGALPRGTLDSASAGFVKGWAYDADAGSDPIDVHFYIDKQFYGAVRANARRDDLVAARVATEPFHGFVWHPPVLPAGEHILEAFAINVGPSGVLGTSAGSNPLLTAGRQAFTVPTGEHHGVITLDNGVLRVGANLSWGGAITELSHAGTNLVDDHDTGRLVQASLYDGTERYVDHGGEWGWNAVQGGDKHNQGSRTTAYTKTAPSTSLGTSQELFIRSEMRQWNPDDKGGGFRAPVDAGITLETWLTLDPNIPELLKVRQRAITTVSRTRTGDHEFPALFAAPFLNRLLGYQGSSPWTDGELTEFHVPELADGMAELVGLPEKWAAWVNAQGFGLGLYVPNHNRGMNMNAYRHNGTTSYLRPGIYETIAPNRPIDITYYLVIGDVDDIRDTIESIR